ncbi:MAG: DUF1538 domain-containing protein [Clostridiales Family XIII bacterium]|nr:DUF1538 domain-containing protein [Clostridiales Family XIII bacterium]
MLHSILLQKNLVANIKDALSSVLPITIIVLALNFTFTPMPFAVRGLFIIGAIFLILGMGLFTLGADLAMLPMGEHIGSFLTRSKKIWLMIAVALIMGTMVTMAEPDLQVLARLAPGIPGTTLIVTVAAGVGVFLVVAVLRIAFQLRLSYMLIAFYIVVFGIGFFVPDEFLAIAYDSGGVTTGPITVPFILAFGVGLASVRGGKSSHDDSFGLVALCSIGPILAVLMLGVFFNPGPAPAQGIISDEVTSVADLLDMFGKGFPVYFSEVGLALSPIVVFFLLFQIIALRLPVTQLIKMGAGIVYTFFGLVLFLTGVNVGFLPAGAFIGEYIGGLDYAWILIPLGLVLGYFTVAVEPAVHVLNEQVFDMTGGAISKKSMLLSLSCGVALSVALSMVRILFGIHILFFLIPGYALALAMTFFTPKIFSAVAFDSGGVASGAMTATFLLPFTLGACNSLGGDALRDAFGLVALVAMTPLITIQIMGLIYKFKLSKTEKEERSVMGESEYAFDRADSDRFAATAALYESDARAPKAGAASVAGVDRAGPVCAETPQDAIDDNDYIDFAASEYDADFTDKDKVGADDKPRRKSRRGRSKRDT